MSAKIGLIEEVKAVGFKREREYSILDVGEEEETKILLRYDQILRALVRNGYKLNGSIAQMDTIDWSVCYSIQGLSYFDEVQSQLNYTVLHAALLLTIAMPAYVNPPSFADPHLGHFFMAFAGMSSVSNLMSIISATIFSTILNRPYTGVDAMVLRVTSVGIFVFAIVFDYVGMFTLFAAVIIAGFNVSAIDGFVQLYSGGLILAIIVAWIQALQTTNRIQLEKVVEFKNRYLAEDGQLSDAWVKLLYRPDTLEEFLQTSSALTT